jgi:ParB family chromosome partitioning protein
VTRVERMPSEADDASSAPLFISVSKIAPNPAQPRKLFRESELAALAASIREQGVLQPLVVRRRGDGYELIIGERRWRAAQLAGLDEVPAVVLDATDRQVVEMALVENVQRADLNPMELAEAFRVLIDDEGMTQDEAGRRVGLDRSSVANHLRLLELPREIQQDLIDQRLTMGHAKAILQVPVEQRSLVRDQIIRSSLSVRAAEELGRRAASSAPRQPRPGPVRDVHVADLEERLRKALQTKVRIVGRRSRGRIELQYFGEGELERLSDRLLGDS